MKSNDDPYVILGIPRGSNVKEIKKTYHELAKIYHPDSSGVTDSKMFAKIQHAYSQICDELKHGKLNTQSLRDDEKFMEHLAKQREWEKRMKQRTGEKMETNGNGYNVDEWERAHGLGQYADVKKNEIKPNTNAFGEDISKMTKDQAFFHRRNKKRDFHTLSRTALMLRRIFR